MTDWIDDADNEYKEERKERAARTARMRAGGRRLYEALSQALTRDVTKIHQKWPHAEINIEEDQDVIKITKLTLPAYHIAVSVDAETESLRIERLRHDNLEDMAGKKEIDRLPLSLLADNTICIKNDKHEIMLPYTVSQFVLKSVVDSILKK
jgi:hypothetical protein